jgi:DNA-binding NarL/FixJ family response regulator
MSIVWGAGSIPLSARYGLGRAAGTIRTVVVDDVWEYLQIEDQLLNCDDIIDVVGRTSDCDGALELIAKLGPDMVLIDIGARPFRYLRLVRTAHILFPKLNIVTLSNENCIRLEAICKTSRTYTFVQKSGLRSALEQILLPAFQNRFQTSPPKSNVFSSPTIHFDNNHNAQ